MTKMLVFELILFITMLVIVIVLSIVAVFWVFKSAPSVDDADKKPTTTLVSNAFPWSENLRNIKQTVYPGMPPCFEINSDARNMYAIIDSRQKKVQHRHFLDMLSIMLCQSADVCTGSTSRFKERSIQVYGSGGDPSDSNSRNIVAMFVSYPDDKLDITKFIVACVQLLYKHFGMITNDADIPDNEKQLLQGHLTSFLRTVLQDMYNKCQ